MRGGALRNLVNFTGFFVDSKLHGIGVDDDPSGLPNLGNHSARPLSVQGFSRRSSFNTEYQATSLILRGGR